MGTPSFGFSRAQGGATGFSPAQGGSAAAWTPESLTGLVDEWDAAATYCTTDAAADMTAASSHYFSRTSPASVLQGPSSGWWKAVWFYVSSTASINYKSSCFGNPGAGNTGWGTAILSGGAVRCWFYDGAGGSTVKDSSGTASTGTWQLMVWGYDGDKGFVSINGGNKELTASITYAPNTTNDYWLGRFVGYFNGRLGLNCGDVGAITNAQISDLWNSGAGNTYENSPITLSSSGYWHNLHEASGARADSHTNGYDLTAVNTPGVAAGVASGTVQDRAPVKTWTGRVNSVLFSQATIGLQPLWREDYFGAGLPAVVNDGTDDLMSCTFTSEAQPWHLFWAGKKDADVAGNERFLGRGSGGYLHSGSTWGAWAGTFANPGSISSENTDPHLVEFLANGASGSLIVDGVGGTSTDFGANACAGWSLGGDLAVQGQPAHANVIMVGDEVSGADLTSLRDYMNAKVGL